MILAIKSSLVFCTGAGFTKTGLGTGLATTRTGVGTTSTTCGLGAFARIATKPGSLVLVSWYPFSSAVYLTVIKDPSGST